MAMRGLQTSRASTARSFQTIFTLQGDIRMRKLLLLLVGTVLCSGVVLAAEVITITGEGKCSKCALKETPKCANVIVVEEGGKSTTYYLAQNKTSKDYHKTVCTAPVKTTATGEVSEKDGKKVFTATKIEEAK